MSVFIKYKVVADKCCILEIGVNCGSVLLDSRLLKVLNLNLYSTKYI